MTCDFKTLTNGNTSPVVRIDRDVTIDGKHLPLLVADEPIEVSYEPGDNGCKKIRLTLMTWGPVIVDGRVEGDRDNNQVQVINPPDRSQPPAHGGGPL